MDNRTITVEGYFGKDKEITKDDFVKQWTDHAQSFHRLNPCDGNYEKVLDDINMIIDTVRVMAENEFERLYDLQSLPKRQAD